MNASQQYLELQQQDSRLRRAAQRVVDATHHEVDGRVYADSPELRALERELREEPAQPSGMWMSAS